MWTKKVKINKITAKGKRKGEDALLIEKESHLYINNNHKSTLYHFPQLSKELAYGYVHCHINQYDPIQSIQMEDNTIHIKIIAEKLPSIQKLAAPQLNPEEIFHLTAYFQENALLFKQTAISESIGLATHRKIEYFCEDLHVQNAFYKAIGCWKLDKQVKPLEKLICLTSAKVDHQFLNCVANTGIKYIISRTAPTYNACENAKKAGIKIIGFARGTRYNIY